MLIDEHVNLRFKFTNIENMFNNVNKHERYEEVSWSSSILGAYNVC